ncbi:MAG: thiamine phosphate synthase, partial [Gammaproteobacteria bacterium]|nr:thiamine phosphate synthase [Gammaproteobacteria bacterium]
SPELLTRAKQTLSVPVVAIGGITVNNADSLIKAGADAVAVINGLFKQPEIKKTAQTFSKLFKN